MNSSRKPSSRTARVIAVIGVVAVIAWVSEPGVVASMIVRLRRTDAKLAEVAAILDIRIRIAERRYEDDPKVSGYLQRLRARVDVIRMEVGDAPVEPPPEGVLP
jgi:hypothetical protein